MNIRIADKTDREGIREIHLGAFDNKENEIVANLAIDLLTETSSPQTITLVAEIDDLLVGHVAFSPIRLRINKQLLGYILAPLAIKPECQHTGIGSKLVEEGLQQLKQQGIYIVFVYGDPNYYSRFGFVANLAQKFIPPYTLQYPVGWQAIELDSENRIASAGSVECVSALCKPELW